MLGLIHQFTLGLGSSFQLTLEVNPLLLDAARAFVSWMMFMTLLTGLRLTWRYPTVLAFWLAMAPLPFVLLYYASQLYLARFAGVNVTLGILYVNIVMGLVFAGYWTLLGMLRRIYPKVYGVGRPLHQRLVSAARPWFEVR